jgi:RNA polymerase sigma-70 factor, ECF subfamily
MSESQKPTAPSPSPEESRTGDKLNRFTSAEYEKLRELAHRLRRRATRGRAGPGTDSLVHDAYLSLKSSGNESWNDRAHFLAVASLQLRHLLVDHARATHADKRGGDQVRVSFDEGSIVATKPAMDVLVLDDALNRLSRVNPRQHRVAELRLFGGLSVEEIAEVLAVSQRTVKGDWHLAREWLAKQLRSGSGADA